ncbi:MAG TPA: hypothetical protein ENK94_00720 [Campylobacterales bacterium]|nr:hypothetical protein [Campylobacterales bacterium]
MRRGMFTVEVLISIFILFLVVTLSASSSKFLNQMLEQQERYKKIYSLVFSIKDKISKDICSQQNRIQGAMAGVEYVAQCQLVKAERGFEKDYDFDTGKELNGHTGPYLFSLYKVDLELTTFNYSVSYYLNRYKRKLAQ